MTIENAGMHMLRLGGFDIRSGTAATVSGLLYDACADGRKLRLFFANTNLIVRCRYLIPRIAFPPVMIINDGIGLELAAWMMHGRGFRENLNGSDFFPRFCRASPRPMKFFLLGSRPGVGARAALEMESRLGQQVVGVCDGYAEFKAAGAGLPAMINASGAEVVLVAFGNPLQEQWILDHCEAIDAPVMMGVGALLDFLSGSARRAPPWVRSLRLEWLYRLSREPGRLLRRYSIEMLAFFWICLRAGRRPKLRAPSTPGAPDA
jgi:beta-1,4-glucosyltransferase